MKSTGLKASEFDGDCSPRVLPTPERTYLCLHASNGSDQTDARMTGLSGAMDARLVGTDKLKLLYQRLI